MVPLKGIYATEASECIYYKSVIVDPVDLLKIDHKYPKN